jgi:chromate reductase
MAHKYKIGIFVGSLRKESFSRKIANIISKLFEGDFDAKIIEIGSLEMFDQDYDDEGKTPQSWIVFREQIAAIDAVLFITPEYNRSYPAVIKNAIDIASRPIGKNVWAGKAGAVISVSLSPFGGFGANQHLLQPLGFLGINLMRQPEQYIANIDLVLDKNGNLADEHKKKSLEHFAQAFEEWINIFGKR